MRELLIVGLLLTSVCAGALLGVLLGMPLDTEKYYINKKLEAVNTGFPLWGILVGADVEQGTLTISTTLHYPDAERRTLRLALDRRATMQTLRGTAPLDALSLRQTHLGKGVFVAALRAEDGSLTVKSVSPIQTGQN